MNPYCTEKTVCVHNYIKYSKSRLNQEVGLYIRMDVYIRQFDFSL